MQALVGQALIEIRATWEGVAADTDAALAEVEGADRCYRGANGASVGDRRRRSRRRVKAMAAAVKTRRRGWDCMGVGV